MKVKDLILISLICINIVFASVMLTLYVGRSEPAAMANTSTRAGDYIMVTGPISDTREALLIVDIVAQRANLYIPEAGAGRGGTQFKLASTRYLPSDFASSARKTR
jgi:hypothetical protein